MTKTYHDWIKSGLLVKYDPNKVIFNHYLSYSPSAPGIFECTKCGFILTETGKIDPTDFTYIVRYIDKAMVYGSYKCPGSI